MCIRNNATFEVIKKWGLEHNQARDRRYGAPFTILLWTELANSLIFETTECGGCFVTFACELRG